MDKACYDKIYENEERHWWFRGKLDIIKSLFTEFSGGMESKKILDAGCGTSFLSKSIFPDINNIYNVDNCELSLNYSRLRRLPNVIQSDLEKLPFGDGYFNFCVCTDVLEHNENDSGLVKELARVLSAGGIIVASVPAMQVLWGPQDVKLGHCRRYGIKSFAALFFNDFEILKISYFNSLLFLPMLLFRKLASAFPFLLKERDELDINNDFFNKLLYKIFSFEVRLLKYINFPFGVSIFIAGRKK